VYLAFVIIFEQLQLYRSLIANELNQKKNIDSKFVGQNRSVVIVLLVVANHFSRRMLGTDKLGGDW